MKLRDLEMIALGLSFVACVVETGARLDIAVEGSGNTSPSPGSHLYASGTTVKVSAMPSRGATFIGWSGAATGAVNPVSVVVDREQKLVARFSGGSGGGASDAGSYDSGSSSDAGSSDAGSFDAGSSDAGSPDPGVSDAGSPDTGVSDAGGGGGSTVSINAGGSAVGTFLADTYYSGGSTFSTANAIDTSLITGDVPPASVFQTERYGELTYTIPNRTPGAAQTVALYFQESFWSAAGERTFDVAINGATVLSAFDIFDAAGGANKAIARTFSTTADDSGQVVIRLIRSGPDQPKICGITVTGDGETRPTLTVSKSGSGSGTVTSSPEGIRCGSTCSASYASGAAVTLTATADAGSTFAGWSGACTGTAACTLSMSSAQTVIAAFDASGGTGCEVPSRFQWSSTGAIIGPPSGFTGIKDPSVVFYDNLWHVFASVTDGSGNYTIQYLSFPDWNQAGSATKATTPFGNGHAAPQVFYFTPQKKWYMIYEWGNVYSTNSDLSNPSGWSGPKSFYATEPPIVAQNKGNGGMIDFWVICDAANCYLFFSDDNGHLYRGQTTIASFPNGFSQPVIVMSDSPAGRLFEACNIYSMKGTGKYLLLVEAFDSGSGGKRYFRSWTATALDGTWTPLQAEYSTPFASATNVAFGGNPWTQDISHGEVLRSGYDEKLEIDMCNLKFLYQGMTPGSSGNYNTLPWKLGLLTKAN